MHFGQRAGIIVSWLALLLLCVGTAPCFDEVSSRLPSLLKVKRKRVSVR